MVYLEFWLTGWGFISLLLTIELNVIMWFRRLECTDPAESHLSLPFCLITVVLLAKIIVNTQLIRSLACSKFTNGHCPVV